MSKEIVSQACGKTILTGEHIVVYGYPAVLLPLNVYTQCKINNIRPSSPYREKNIVISALDKQTALSWEDIDKCCTHLKENTPDIRLGLTLWSLKTSLDFFETRNYPSFNLQIESSVPTGGFGSSTAAASAIVRGMAELANRSLSPSELYELLVDIETRNGAVVSGADQYVVSHEIPIKFKKNTTPEEININSEMLNYFLIINSGTPSSTTKDCVDYVAQLRNSDPERTDNIFNRLAEQGVEMIDSIQENDADRFFNSVKESGELLISLGVVSPQSIDLIRKIEDLDGYLKLTGAGTISHGGSGGILCFSDTYDKIEAFLNEINVGYLRASI